MPRCSVVTAVHDPEREHLAACLDSVGAQTLTDIEHIVVDDGSTRPYVSEMLAAAADADRRVRIVRRPTSGGIVAASTDGLAAATGEFIALVDHDDVLEATALATMIDALESAGVDVAYSDHDLILPDGRYVAPYFKPDFSPEQLRNQNYVLHLLVVRRAAIVDVGGFREGFDGAQDHDLLLRLAERPNPFVHVPEVLYHWRQSPDSVASSPDNKPWAFEAGLRAVREHCVRSGINAEVEAGAAPGTYRLRRSPKDARRVSVIIPTRGTTRRVWNVNRCFVTEAVASLIDHATSPDLEFVVVYDTATPPPVLATLQRIAGDRLVLVEYTEEWNFSRKINVGAAAATGELLLVLNDDTELIEPTSIETMVAHLDDPGVGMVGPKLLYADGRIQDAGHVYNGHLLPGLAGWAGDGTGPWQLRPLIVEREVSGVTAAAALVERAVFDEVGGFDESMPVNFNDVDFSLKIRASGRRVIWTPHASWHHFESQTRPPTAAPEEFTAIQQRWHHEIEHDPYYNPNLAPFRADWLEQPLHSGEPMIEPDTTTGRWLRQRLFGGGLNDDRSTAGRLRLLLFALALALLIWAATTAQDAEPGLPSRLLATWLPWLIMVSTVAMAMSRRRWALAAGLVTATSPAVISLFGSGRRQAFVAAATVVVALAFGPLQRLNRRIAAAGGLAALLIGLLSWWLATPSAPDPAGIEFADVLRSAITPADGWSATIAVAAWLSAVGLVVAAVIASGVPRALVVPGAAVVVFAGTSAALLEWRGTVDARDGLWLVMGGLVIAAARAETTDRRGRTIMIAVILLSGAAWIVTAAAPESPPIAAIIAAALALLAVAWSVSDRGEQRQVRASGSGRAPRR